MRRDVVQYLQGDNDTPLPSYAGGYTVYSGCSVTLGSYL